MHLTGIYPDDWEGKRFDGPIEMWAATDSTEATRDILQVAYLGSVKEEEFGTGSIPKDCLLAGKNTKWDITRRQGIADAVDTVSVQHYDKNGKPDGVSKLGFKSYEQGRKKFQGTRKQVIHLDEEPPSDIYDECMIRLTKTNPSEPESGIMMLTMTPLSGMTDMVERFWNNSDEDVPHKNKVFIQASWEDADHISPEEKEALREATPEHMREARERGIPSIGEGMVYPIAESLFVVPRKEIPNHWKQAYALDFGWNPDPTAALFMAYDPDTDVLYLTKEYKVNEAPPKAHAQALHKLGADWMKGVADPYGGTQANQADGETMIKKYQEVGLRLQAADRQYKMNGIIDVLELMREGKLKVFEDLEGWLKEFRMYAYDEKGKPKDKNDHLMDCTRYLVQSGMRVAKSKRNLVQRFWDDTRQTRPSWEAV
jgi:phage terminase large subunit-like protein